MPISRPPWGRRVAALHASLALAIALLPLSPARGEFTVGDGIAAFSLPAADGQMVALERADDKLTLMRGDEKTPLNVLAIHLLQPDCLQCHAQLKALQKLHESHGSRGLTILGISHREDMAALQRLRDDLKITFPLLHGTGSELARQFAAGDTFALVDATGVIRFAQVGFGAGDDDAWRAAADEMLAGKPPTKSTIDRERLKPGDSFPAVKLPALVSDKPMEMAGRNGRLVFIGEDGKEARPMAAIGFFSRY